MSKDASQSKTPPPLPVPGVMVVTALGADDLMPDGRPAPAVMTKLQAAQYLQLEGTDRQRVQSIDYHVRVGNMRATILQRRTYITLAELKAFVIRQTKPLNEPPAERRTHKPEESR